MAEPRSVRPHPVTMEQLESRLLLSAAMPFAAGGVAATAENLGTLAGRLVSRGELAGPDRYDTFQFRVTRTKQVHLLLDGMTQNADLELRDARNQRVALSAGGGIRRDQIRSQLRAGTYSVRVYRRGGATPYRLRLIGDPDGTIATARDLGVVTGPRSITGSLANLDRDDYYRIELPAPTDLSLSLTMNRPDADLRLLNSEGEVIAGSTRRGRRTESIRATLAAGTYYIRVSRYRSNPRYTLTLTPRAIDSDGTRDRATDVGALSGTAAYHDSVGGLDDNDFYRFDLAALSDFSLRLDGLASDADVQLQSAAGTVIGQSVRGGTSAEDISGRLQAGTYYVRVYPYTGSTGYDLTLTAQTYDPDDTRDEATNLGALTDTAEVHDSIGGADLNDYFRFVIATTSDVGLALTGLAANADVELQDAAGAVIGWSVEAGTADEAISAELGAGTYYVRVYASGGVTGYDLLLEADAIAPPDPDPAPGDTVVGRMVTVGGETLLQVLGTNGADVITLWQDASGITLLDGTDEFTFGTAVEGIVVYGFGGTDTIHTTYSVTTPTVIYGGGGADTIFENGAAASVVYGGEGADLIVTVGGGGDTLLGDGSSDSFWYDAGDAVGDASAAELNAGRLHEIIAFHQPWSTNPSSVDYVGLDISGQDLRDPQMTGYADHYASFADRALFADGPQFTDIEQGSLGDCYYLASLASLADADPDVILEMIAPLGDGTYAVRFYRGGDEVYLRIDAELPVRRSGLPAYADLSPQGETWVALAEKAYAFFRYGENSYSSIEGGWMEDVYLEVTGGPAVSRSTGGSASSLASYVRQMLADGHAMTLGSKFRDIHPIVGGHAYMLVSIDASNYVTVYNPWAVDGSSWDANPSDGLLRLSLSKLQECFSILSVSLV